MSEFCLSQLFRCGEEITDWVYRDRHHQLVVIHPDPETLIANARMAIQYNVNLWEKANSLNWVRKKFEDDSEEDLLH